MPNSALQDAFAHHGWATLRVIDACRELTRDQLDTVVPGTYGSILRTLRHLVGSDAYYLFVLSGGEAFELDEEALDLDQLGALMAANGAAWGQLLDGDPDPGADVIRHRDDGTDSHAPMSIRLAQALHHGTDHRSQVCTALTTLGIEPPAIDVWDFGTDDGRVFVTQRG